MPSTYHADKMFAVAPEHLKTGADYAIDIYEDKVVFEYTKSLLPAAMANQQGIIGMLLNKVLSGSMKKEEFTFSLNGIQKVELATSSVMGQTNKNLMFWNVAPAEATYENIYFTLNIKTDEEGVKKALATLLQKVDYTEISV